MHTVGLSSRFLDPFALPIERRHRVAHTPTVQSIDLENTFETEEALTPICCDVIQ